MTKFEKLATLLDLVSATIDEINAENNWVNSIINVQVDDRGKKEIHIFNPTSTFLPHKMEDIEISGIIEHRREGKIMDCNLFGFEQGA